MVDDEVAVRNLYQLYLETHGYLVISASSVSEALRILRQEQIAVLILDIFLGEENGLDLLKAMVAARTAVPVIVMSGIASDNFAFKDALNSGAAAVFTKALPLNGLLNEIKKLARDPDPDLSENNYA